MLGHLTLERLPHSQLLFLHASPHPWTATSQPDYITLQNRFLLDCFHEIRRWSWYLRIFEFYCCCWSAHGWSSFLSGWLLPGGWSNCLLCLRLTSFYSGLAWLRGLDEVSERERRFVTLRLLFLKLLNLLLGHLSLRNFAILDVLRAPRLFSITLTWVALLNVLERHSIFGILSVLRTRIRRRTSFCQLLNWRFDRAFRQRDDPLMFRISLWRTELLQLDFADVTTLVHATQEALTLVGTRRYPSYGCSHLCRFILDFEVVSLLKVQIVFITRWNLSNMNSSWQLAPSLAYVLVLLLMFVSLVIVGTAWKLLTMLRLLLSSLALCLLLKLLGPLIRDFVLLVRDLLHALLHLSI